MSDPSNRCTARKRNGDPCNIPDADADRFLLDRSRTNLEARHA